MSAATEDVSKTDSPDIDSVQNIAADVAAQVDTNSTTKPPANRSSIIDPNNDAPAPTTRHPPPTLGAPLIGANATLTSIFSTFLDNLTAKLPPPSSSTSAHHNNASTSASRPSGRPDGSAASAAAPLRSNLRRTSDLLDTLQKALAAPPPAKMPHLQLVPPQRKPVADGAAAAQTAPNDAKTPCFSAAIEVLAAENLSRIGGRQKKSHHKEAAPQKPPNAYVTFEAADGAVLTTGVVERSACPQWRKRFERVLLPVELLTNPAKRIELKLWHKAHIAHTAKPHEDTPMGGVLVGLQASALPLCDWYNVTDTLGKQCGRLQIRVTANEDVAQYLTAEQKLTVSSEAPVDIEAVEAVGSEAIASANPVTSNDDGTAADEPADASTATVETALPEADSDPLIGINTDALDETIRRKFTELEDISKRLKLRLGDVTDLANFDDVIDDVMDAEFEQYLNTEPDEEEQSDDDFDWSVTGEKVGVEKCETTEKGNAKESAQKVAAEKNVDREQQDANDASSGAGANTNCDKLSETLRKTTLNDDPQPKHKKKKHRKNRKR